jgi:hypothetical protein
LVSSSTASARSSSFSVAIDLPVPHNAELSGGEAARLERFVMPAHHRRIYVQRMQWRVADLAPM